MTRLYVYPEDRGSAAPTAARVLDVFTGLTRHHRIDHHGHLVQTFQPELSPLHHQILDLLGITQTAYHDA